MKIISIMKYIRRAKGNYQMEMLFGSDWKYDPKSKKT